jgi:ParB-like chromosome segregation protein Spo0J
MSVARKQFSGALDVLGVVDPYGAKVESAEGEMLITPELDTCQPDPHQPRHILPDDLRERLGAGATAAEVLWETWQRCLGEPLYRALRSHDLTPEEALAQRREEGVQDLALQLTLEGLVELAGSIARHGLRNPINVYDLGGGMYRIAEGERRWWAHVLMRDVLLRVEASTILARIHPLPPGELTLLARQQAENVHRRDLSAIARARAITRVREALALEVSGTSGSTNPRHPPVGQEVSGTGGSTNLGGRPRHLAAITSSQLDDLTGQRLAELTGRGMTGRTVRLYLALLSLPLEAQALAEAAALGERALRPIVSLDDAEEQIRLVQALAAGEMTPSQVATTAKRIKKQTEKQEKRSRSARALARFRASLRFAASADLPEPDRLVAQIAQLPPKKRREVLDYARRYLSLLQAVLEAGDPLLAQDDPSV